MPRDGAVSFNPTSPFPTPEELGRSIDSKTHRQVRDLKINCSGKRVRLTGRSRTYYAKQLATQAVCSLLPGAQLENEIMVCAG